MTMTMEIAIFLLEARPAATNHSCTVLQAPLLHALQAMSQTIARRPILLGVRDLSLFGLNQPRDLSLFGLSQPRRRAELGGGGGGRLSWSSNPLMLRIRWRCPSRSSASCAASSSVPARWLRLLWPARWLWLLWPARWLWLLWPVPSM